MIKKHSSAMNWIVVVPIHANLSDDRFHPSRPIYAPRPKTVEDTCARWMITLAAIAGPMAYAYYRSMPDTLVYQALKKLPEWMVDVSERFDEVVNGGVK